MMVAGTGAATVACGESAPPNTAASVIETRGMTVLVDVPSDRVGSSLAHKLESRLRREGFRIARSDEPYDLKAEFSIDVRETHGLITVRVNGKEKVGHVAAVRLSVMGDGSAIETAMGEFDVGDPVEDDAVEPFVAAFKSDAVAQYAEDLRGRKARQAETHKKEAAAQAKAERKEAARAAEEQVERDDKAWLEAGTVACKVPSALTDCDAVRSYLVKFPKGRHVDDATGVLSAADPALLKLQKDEKQWRESGAETCRGDVGDDPCAGIDVYVSKYPSGLHIDEARRVRAESKARSKEPSP
jgi:hypothetical protein